MGIAVNGRPEKQFPKPESEEIKRANAEISRLNGVVSDRDVAISTLKALLERTYDALMSHTYPEDASQLKRELKGFLDIE